MTLTDLMMTEVWNGQTVADLLSVEFLASAVGSVLGAVALLVLGYFVSGWVRRRLIRLGQKYKELDDTLFTFLGNLARYAILTFAVLFVLNTFGVQTTSIVAVIGAAGLAIGLALQGTLSNVAAGVMIVVFRPFKLGDFVEVSGQMGTVMTISLNCTELARPDNVQVIIPNANVWGNTITNYSTNGTRRAEWVFGVGYGADLKLAEDTIRTTLMADPRTLKDPAEFVQVNNLGASSVDFLARTWVNSSDYFTYQADMKRKVKEALDAAGVDIPFPTRTIVQG
ncbi:Small-conductance mechanosensitive channel [Thalassovita gelatinovora]|uniref:Small-conductance mechanosensitive channel n=1 Tax=Thalassovita gelatinovora TaxID=53501 RepID=A0A0P1F5P0_THAGE|nr:mechanosensitive ion channel domain-containing protein [Thalassovita gelatinovora]QIZ80790.1 mechanosensitive ion channel [Thalassovita gelatinovora]CUH63173.1 Small-conductance mechanosensitive channel [Thalassovita gelatinovora]SEQ62947.1 small conductance mechanosensitive channel [Thalassovita gelatinovora]